MVQEVTVVGDGDQCAGILRQMLLQPFHGLGVEVVGGLVQQQDVGLLQQQPAQGHAAAFTAGQVLDLLVVRRTAQGVHGAVQLVVDVPGVGGVQLVLQFGLTLHQFVHLAFVLQDLRVAEGVVDLFVFLQQVHHMLHALLDHLPDSLLRVEPGILLQISYTVAGGEHHVSLVGLVDAGYDPEQRRLSGAVQTDDADLGSVEEGEVYVLKDLFLRGDGLGDSHH